MMLSWISRVPPPMSTAGVEKCVCAARPPPSVAGPRLPDPLDVGDRIVDVVDEDLAHAGSLPGCVVAEVLQPAIVGPDARQPKLVVGCVRWAREQVQGGKERGDGVGEQHLGHRSVRVGLTQPTIVVPVAGAFLPLQVAEGVLEPASPLVEFVVPLRLQITPVGVVVGSRVAVRRDQDKRIFAGTRP